MYVVNISDDLQNPPEDGIRLKEYAKKNKLDLVFGVYSQKNILFGEIWEVFLLTLLQIFY